MPRRKAKPKTVLAGVERDLKALPGDLASCGLAQCALEYLVRSIEQVATEDLQRLLEQDQAGEHPHDRDFTLSLLT